MKITPKKQILLEASLKLFLKYGFHATTFQMIADEVGITQPGVFIHFKNKMDLFAALRFHVAQNNRDFVDSKITIRDSALESLKKHCLYNLDWVVEHPDQSQLIILLYHYACFDGEMKELNRRALDGGQERILKYLLAAARENTFKSKQPEEMAAYIQAMIIGQSVQYLSMKKRPSKQTIEKDIDVILKRLSS